MFKQVFIYLQEVIRLETQYWTLVDIPKQEKQETVPAFVLRACAIMEKTQKSGEGVKTAAKIAEEEEKRRERLERLSGQFALLDTYDTLIQFHDKINRILNSKADSTEKMNYSEVIGK